MKKMLVLLVLLSFCGTALAAGEFDFGVCIVSRDHTCDAESLEETGNPAYNPEYTYVKTFALTDLTNAHLYPDPLELAVRQRHMVCCPNGGKFFEIVGYEASEECQEEEGLHNYLLGWSDERGNWHLEARYLPRDLVVEETYSSLYYPTSLCIKTKQEPFVSYTTSTESETYELLPECITREEECAEGETALIATTVWEWDAYSMALSYNTHLADYYLAKEKNSEQEVLTTIVICCREKTECQVMPQTATIPNTESLDLELKCYDMGKEGEPHTKDCGRFRWEIKVKDEGTVQGTLKTSETNGPVGAKPKPNQQSFIPLETDDGVIEIVATKIDEEGNIVTDEESGEPIKCNSNITTVKEPPEPYCTVALGKSVFASGEDGTTTATVKCFDEDDKLYYCGDPINWTSSDPSAATMLSSTPNTFGAMEVSEVVDVQINSSHDSKHTNITATYTDTETDKEITCSYQLTVQGVPRPSNCGNGIIEWGEQCDYDEANGTVIFKKGEEPDGTIIAITKPYYIFQDGKYMVAESENVCADYFDAEEAPGEMGCWQKSTPTECDIFEKCDVEKFNVFSVYAIDVPELLNFGEKFDYSFAIRNWSGTPQTASGTVKLITATDNAAAGPETRFVETHIPENDWKNIEPPPIDVPGPGEYKLLIKVDQAPTEHKTFDNTQTSLPFVVRQIQTAPVPDYEPMLVVLVLAIVLSIIYVKRKQTI